MRVRAGDEGEDEGAGEGEGRHAVRVGAARVRVDDVLVHRVDVRLVDAHAPG